MAYADLREFLGHLEKEGELSRIKEEVDWEDTQELMLQFGGMKKRLPVEEFYTNEFIP